MSKKQQTPTERVAEQVRDAATAAGVTRADLRRELDITDWRTIQARWLGEQPYTIDELDALGRLLGTTFTIPEH